MKPGTIVQNVHSMNDPDCGIFGITLEDDGIFIEVLWSSGKIELEMADSIIVINNSSNGIKNGKQRSMVSHAKMEKKID
tara:strand:- start:233 stop:469 length:237 start_codon:yes stop_codon:yes gene_type:complete